MVKILVSVYLLPQTSSLKIRPSKTTKGLQTYNKTHANHPHQNKIYDFSMLNIKQVFTHNKPRNMFSNIEILAICF
jgi:hypothetical protein